MLTEYIDLMCIIVSVDREESKIQRFVRTYRSFERPLHPEHLQQCVSIALRKRQAIVLANSDSQHPESKVGISRQLVFAWTLFLRGQKVDIRPLPGAWVAELLGVVLGVIPRP